VEVVDLRSQEPLTRIKATDAIGGDAGLDTLAIETTGCRVFMPPLVVPCFGP
jgi:hypothetical protein